MCIRDRLYTPWLMVAFTQCKLLKQENKFTRVQMNRWPWTACCCCACCRKYPLSYRSSLSKQGWLAPYRSDDRSRVHCERKCCSRAEWSYAGSSWLLLVPGSPWKGNSRKNFVVLYCCIRHDSWQLSNSTKSGRWKKNIQQQPAFGLFRSHRLCFVFLLHIWIKNYIFLFEQKLYHFKYVLHR